MITMLWRPLIFHAFQMCLGLCLLARPSWGSEGFLGSDARKPMQVANNIAFAKTGRVALVIGNADYKSSPLSNPVNDARDMERVLKQLGFEVIMLANSDLQQMENGLRTFHEKLKQGNVGLFYYAGHGVQSDGNNYLIPIDAKLDIEGDLKREALDVGKVLDMMEDARNSTNIIILDACRDNPLKRRWRTTQRGLASINTAKGVYIAYATSPGKTAADGTGSNGTFTAALLKQIVKPHKGIDDLFNQVREDVNRDTGGKQVPWTTSSLIGSFSFYNSDSASQRSTATESLFPTPKGLIETPSLDLPEMVIPCAGSVC